MPAGKMILLADSRSDQALRIVSPPSTGNVAPVTKPAAGRHSDKVICATSSGSA
jgi:hypothetical protein